MTRSRGPRGPIPGAGEESVQEPAMTRHMSLVPPPARCEHTEERALTWRCTLPPHGPDQRHVLRTVR